ncbi:MAG: hypothetical protein KME25_25720 [Symplocastrum torsivum CPER-KK1]|uniref:Uncharacterized protein n=1 Tax=Symplocastrum torsivum CPER-KK1 TaxID=450513 RepID=A0A951UC64_9CYAN|nr:hypothetical protein [Symplocastrum torsivum CPER-KK1]
MSHQTIAFKRSKKGVNPYLGIWESVKNKSLSVRRNSKQIFYVLLRSNQKFAIACAWLVFTFYLTPNTFSLTSLLVGSVMNFGTSENLL